MELDTTDRHMLMLLQKRGRLSTTELAEHVGLSPSPCARRLKRLEDTGIIDGYGARLNVDKIGVGMTIFVQVSLNNHQAAAIAGFETAIMSMEEVVTCHVVSGVYDYLLEVANRDLQGYELFTRKLHRLEHVKDVHTLLAIRRVKGEGVMPIYV